MIAAALLAAFVANAQVPTVLIEACNALPDAAKRLECLKSAMQQPMAATQQSPNPAAFESVDRAFSRMKSNVTVGISYNNYQTAMLDVAQPIAELRRVGVGLSSEGLALLDEAVDTYADAGRFWEVSINFYARRDNSASYFGGLPVGLNNMQWLVNKYGLPTVKADLLGFHAGLNVATTRSALWSMADGKAERGMELLRKADLARIEAQKAEAASKAAAEQEAQRLEKEKEKAAVAAVPTPIASAPLRKVTKASVAAGAKK